MSQIDPFALDRKIAAFASQHARFRAALSTETFREHVFEVRPAELDSHLLDVLERRAGKGDPLARPSQRSLRFLLVEHDCATSSQSVAHAERVRRYPVEGPERGHFTLAELRARALSETPRRSAWLAALSSVAEHAAALRFALWDQRVERFAALGGAPLALEADADATHEAAESFARTTQDAFDELRVRSFDAFVEQGLGRNTPGSFPSRLSLQSLADLFHEGTWLKSLEPKLDRLPRLLGMSSLLLALEGFGGAYHDAGRNPKRPFVLAHDPRGTRRAVFAALFALLPFNRSFAAHRFGVSRPAAPEYLRSVATIVLFGARLGALRAELHFESFGGQGVYRERFLEAVPRYLGFELSRNLAGAVLADDEGLMRFAGLLGGAAMNDRLTETYDEDWFRNPRAVEALRAELESPPDLELGKAEIERGGKLLARHIAEHL